MSATLRLRLSGIRQRFSAIGSTATVRHAANEARQLDMSPYRFRTSGMHGRRRASRISMSSSNGNTPGRSATAFCCAQAVAHMTPVSSRHTAIFRCEFARHFRMCRCGAGCDAEGAHGGIYRTRHVFRGQHGAAVTRDTHEEADPIRVVEQEPPRHQLVQQTPKAPDVACSTCSCKGGCR